MDRLRSRKRLVLIICALAVGIGAFAAGCSKGSSDNSGAAGGESGKKLKIVATLFPQYDFARQIAGDYADVTLLLPPGMESHSYDLRPADMIEIRESDIMRIRMRMTNTVLMRIRMRMMNMIRTRVTAIPDIHMSMTRIYGLLRYMLCRWLRI